MGVVNVTPDSFSDGGRFLAPDDLMSVDGIDDGYVQPSVTAVSFDLIC